jgi:hypothetical protein
LLTASTDLFGRQFDNLFAVNIEHILFSPQKHAFEYDLDDFYGPRIAGEERQSDKSG